MFLKIILINGCKIVLEHLGAVFGDSDHAECFRSVCALTNFSGSAFYQTSYLQHAIKGDVRMFKWVKGKLDHTTPAR